MRSRILSSGMTLAGLLFALQALSTTGFSQNKSSSEFRDAALQSTKAARVFKEIMDTPDKGVPRDILDKAECVAVFPHVLKAGFVFGARGGRGVASCRTEHGWSAPAFFDV